MSRIVGTLVIALILVVSGPSVSLAGGYGDLVVQWAGVVDNGEGDNWPHGPFGSLHILIL